MPCRARMRAIVLQGLLLLCFLKISIVCSIIEPGYLDFDNLPDTNFSCVGKVIGGYYADIEANCQMFHVCTIGQLDEPMDIRFLCLNGTVFDQETRVCERVDEVDCSKSEKFYHLNLELYGNTAPPIVEEAEVTEQSKSQSTSTTTPKTTTTRTTRAAFYTTPAPTLPPTTHSTPKVITSNQFPVSSGSDIRFNPEEINIRLTPGNPPIIKSSSVSYQQQAFNGGDPTITITTHTSVFKDKHGPITSSTQKPKAVVNYSLQHNSKPNYHPYDFMYQQTENSDVDYHTDLPSSEYASYESKDYHGDTEEKQVFNVPHTRRPEYSSTVFPSSIKPPHLLNYQRTEKPKPKTATDFPTLPPLTFSSPAPFSLTRHVDAKRSNDNQKRPRIIVSASASVSDASGRRLNYSLGTIGASHIIPKAPSSYDEYKETDVGLDPFYHDVPKVKSSRSKREAVTNNSDSQNKQSIVDIDKIWSPPDYVDDNYEPTVFNSTDNASLPVNTKDSDSVVIIHKEIVSHVEVHSNKSDHVETQSNSTSKDSLVGEQSATPWAPPEYVDDNYEAMTYRKPDNFLQDFNLTGKTDDNSYEDIEYEYYDYVDDNYERSMYESLDLENTTQNETDYLTNTEILTTETHTQPSLVDVTQETTLEVNTVTESIRQTEQTTKAKPYKPDVNKLINKIVDKEIVLDSREKYITPTNSEEVVLRNLNTKGSGNISNSREKYTDFDINTTEITTTPLIQNNNTTQENKIGLVPSKTITNSVSEPDNKLNLLREETKSNLLSNLELPLKLSYETTSYPSFQSKLESNNVETLTSETTTAPSTTVSVLELTTMDTIQTTVGEMQDGISSVTVYPNLETTTESMDTTPYTTTQQSATDETTINVIEFTTMSLPEVQTSVLLNHPEKNETVTSPVPTVLYTSAQLSSKVGFTSNPDTTTDGKVREYTSAIKKSENNEDHESKINKDFTTTEAIATHTTTDGVVETTVVTSTTDFTTSISELDSTTMPTTISSTTRYSYLRTREPAYKRYARTRPTPGKHRFSSHNIHMSQSVLKLQSNLRNPPTTSTSTTTSPLQVKPIESDLPKSRRRQTSRRFSSNIRTKSAYSEDTLTESKEKVSFTTRPSLTKFLDEVPVTDAPLSKSANPTESKSDRGTLLPTTPLSQTLFVPRRFSYDVTRTFNCIGRKMNRFYPDPRDCRLFHYCTPGYTKTQVLDMKFVCDFGTYFDPDKLICTKVKPQRCK